MENHTKRTRKRAERGWQSLSRRAQISWLTRFWKRFFFWFQSRKEIYINIYLAPTDTQHRHSFTSQNVTKEVTCFDYIVDCEAGRGRGWGWGVGRSLVWWSVEGTVGSKSRGQTGTVDKITLKAWQTGHGAWLLENTSLHESRDIDSISCEAWTHGPAKLVDIWIFLSVWKSCGWVGGWVQKGAGSYSVLAAIDRAEVGVRAGLEATVVLAVWGRDGIWFQIEARRPAPSLFSLNYYYFLFLWLHRAVVSFFILDTNCSCPQMRLVWTQIDSSKQRLL